MKQKKLNIRTSGRGFVEITHLVQTAVQEAGIASGLCHVFIHHTSASLIVCENADPDVRGDLERFMANLVPDGAAMFTHVAEGPDDMPAHVRSVLTQTHLTLPIASGTCDLGTWQGVYLWEHRSRAHQRSITVSVHA